MGTSTGSGLRLRGRALRPAALLAAAVRWLVFAAPAAVAHTVSGERASNVATAVPSGASWRGTVRAARATVFGGSSVCLAYLAHVSAGGYHPPALLVAIAVGLAVRIAYGLAGSERGPLALAVGLGASQLALHAAFSVATASPSSHAGGDHHAALLPSGAMTLSHAVAVAATTAALYSAERRIWDTARLRDRLRCAVRGVVAAAEAVGAELRVQLANATAGARTDARPATFALGAHPRIAIVAWLPSSDTTTWRRHVPLGRSSHRRGPPADLGRSTRVVASTAQHAGRLST